MNFASLAPPARVTFIIWLAEKKICFAWERETYRWSLKDTCTVDIGYYFANRVVGPGIGTWIRFSTKTVSRLYYHIVGFWVIFIPSSSDPDTIDVVTG